MCTVIAVQGEHFYFGRNMDLEGHFGECVAVTPRNFDFRFRMAPHLSRHAAMIGMAVVVDGYPLYADACNEHGLCMAGLHFPDHAKYASEPVMGKLNLAPFELIPWVLGQCKNTDEAHKALTEIALVDRQFRHDLPNTPLHWFVADRLQSLTVEHTREGMRVFKNPAGVLTNAPQFDFHIANLCRYGNLSNRAEEGDFAKQLGLRAFATGLSAVGLPGDYSSPSRFVKAAWLRANMPTDLPERERRLSQVFSMLSAVAPPMGSVLTAKGEYRYTTYSCVIDAERCEYFYRTELSQARLSHSLWETEVEGAYVIPFSNDNEALLMQE